MNRRFINAFSAACVLAALAASGSVAYRVLAADASGRDAARADFEGLKSVLAYVRGPSDLADPGLRARLASRYEASPGLLLIDVYERGAGDRWRIPADSPYLPIPSAPGSPIPAPAYPASSTILLSAPLKGDTSGNLAVDALYTTLTQQQVFESFRDAMIGFAAYLALAAFILAIAAGREEEPREEYSGEEEAVKGGQGEFGPETASDLAAAAAEYQYETLSAAGGEDEPEIKEAEDIETPSSEGSVGTVAAGAAEEFDIPVIADEGGGRPSPAAPVQSDLAAASQDEVGQTLGPEGLYSAASGLGWESYLDERLDAELARSASFEQDLSLLVLSYDDVSSQDAEYLRIGEAIESFFSFRDLAFERGDDGFSVVLPNIDSAHAIHMAQEFYKKLAFLAGGDMAELELSPLFMGISSRSGRLVDAQRLEKEAAAALDKARYEKDTRIVAFRPDPDKYRIYLASKGA